MHSVPLPPSRPGLVARYRMVHAAARVSMPRGGAQSPDMHLLIAHVLAKGLKLTVHPCRAAGTTDAALSAMSEDRMAR